MFDNKYNPDIINDYNESEINRNKKYELKNIPYKIIINDDIIKVNTPEDFIIKINNNKNEIINKYEDILKNRNIKNTKTLNKKKTKEIEKQFKLSNIDTNEIPDDFTDIKSNFISEFKEKEDEIKNDRQKFNSIIESLLSDGLLD